MKDEFMRVLIPMIALGSAVLSAMLATGIVECNCWGMTGTFWLIICVAAWSYHHYRLNQARIIKLEAELKKPANPDLDGRH